MKQFTRSSWVVFTLLLLTLVPWAQTLPSLEFQTKETQSRATTTWSGNVWLNSSYHVSSSDSLIITDCTQIWLATNTRIVVDGRLTIQGTTSCPVVLHSQGAGDHDGIQFNSSSRNRGSVIDNLTIEDAEYGITVYNSNPALNYVHIENADFVAIDLFNSASPVIRNLSIQDGGQDISNSWTWRQGIGLSVGNFSTPIIDGFTADGLETRAVNIWGNSGGLYRNLSLTDIGGAVLVPSAAIWIEDSQMLFEDVYIDECDNGVIIRHRSDGSITRAVMRRVVIEDSQFRGLLVDKENHQNYTNYQAAIIEGLEVRGTGGSGAAAQGWAEAAVEINASGAWIEDALIEDNVAPGIRLYFTDSFTTFKDTTVLNSGNPNKGAHKAGIHNRASFFAPEFHNLTVKDSPGPGIWSEEGGAMIGSNWTLENNTEQGLWVDSSSLVVDGLNLNSNGLSGARVFDSRKVEFTNLTTDGNGHASSGPSDGAGLVFIEANDVESNSGDVACNNCLLRNDAWGGVYAEDSVDLWLSNVSIHDPQNGTPTIDVDNGGLTLSHQGGRFQFHAVHSSVNRSGPAIVLKEAAGVINGLEMQGSHDGLSWDADHNGVWTSELSNVILRGADCLSLTNHPDLIGHGMNISSDCSGSVELQNVNANWSSTYDESGAHVISLDASSTLRLHKPDNIDMNQAVIANGAFIDLAWDMRIWVHNQRGNGIPRADMETTFDQYSTDFDYVSGWYGFDDFPNFIGQKWDSSGASAFTQVDIQCSYDNATNTTTFTFDDDKIIYCILDLTNQPPFIVWSTPIDQDVFASGSAVIFNATDSWDLDDDSLNAIWTSSIDGNLRDACAGGQGWGSGNSHLYLETNVVNWSGSGWTCPLSDGVHDITLEVWDGAGNNATETRTIELVNLPPIVSITTSPTPDADNVLRVPWTSNVSFDAFSTTDPEGDELTRRVWASYWSSSQYCTGTDCEEEWNLSFADSPQANFTIEIGFSDSINPEVVWSIEVQLFNELPTPSLVITRDANTSDQMVTLDSTASYDPEGDEMGIRWLSDIDGLLGGSNTSISLFSWQGHLSRGRHTITVQIWDDNPSHFGQVVEISAVLEVENSIPVALIESPVDGLTVDSSTLIEFSAEGSGDWDSWCPTYVAAGIWLCSSSENPLGSDWLSVDWSSNLTGTLTPDGEDWLKWFGRLTTGSHTITLTLDDLRGGVNSTSFTIEVEESAPVLGLITPSDGQGFLSSDTIWVDASYSIDYDGDSYNMSLSSDHPLVDAALLEDVDPAMTYAINLPSGTHILTFTLKDATGRISNESITLVVGDSNPVAVVDAPEIEPGVSKRMSPTKNITLSGNSSYDADGDISSHEWFENINDQWILILDAKWGEVPLSPGNHHLKLVVEDTRRYSDEFHFNLTLSESWPSLSDLIVSKDSFQAGVKSTIKVSVQLSDADGSTKDIEATINHGIQKWTLQLVDQGNGTWTGILEFTPQEAGRPQLKVVATDLSGDDVVTSTLYHDLLVNEALTETNWGYVGGGIGSGAFVILILVFLATRRRKKLSNMDDVESWPSFDTIVQDSLTSDLDQAALVEEHHQEEAPSMIDL
ncbi:MAG: right-handed parallel beta-helix repeat-containing protein [Candidatus Poseidoniales archaeon]